MDHQRGNLKDYKLVLNNELNRLNLTINDCYT